ALRRISEGAAMIRTKGEAGTGDVSHAVKHLREIGSAMKALTVMSDEELYGAAKEHRVSLDLVRMVAKTGKLPVPNFAAGGIATPADAALCMHLGAEAVFVGSGIFKSKNPEKRATAIVNATAHWENFDIIAEHSHGLGEPMKGIAADSIPEEQKLQTR
ncbi:pyridoxal 5'-phosphate synthase lyase subunit PdxS, partial [bacterium]|nr:pyridoxal 5'-phosphate synthase lyase subunit PdxS [bacterium]